MKALPYGENRGPCRTGRTSILDLLDELVLGQRGLEGLDLVALASQNFAAALVDVLQQQDLDILGVKGLELLGFSDGSRAGGVEGGSRRHGCRDAQARFRPGNGDVLCFSHNNEVGRAGLETL